MCERGVWDAQYPRSLEGSGIETQAASLHPFPHRGPASLSSGKKECESNSSGFSPPVPLLKTAIWSYSHWGKTHLPEQVQSEEEGLAWGEMENGDTLVAVAPRRPTHGWLYIQTSWDCSGLLSYLLSLTTIILACPFILQGVLVWMIRWILT